MPIKHGSFHRPGGLDPIEGLNEGWFGDGSDGTHDISTNTTLSRDMYYEDLYIRNGATLFPAGYRIFVKGKLVINSGCKIARNGNPGSVGGGAGAALAAGSLGGSSAGVLEGKMEQPDLMVLEILAPVLEVVAVVAETPLATPEGMVAATPYQPH